MSRFNFIYLIIGLSAALATPSTFAFSINEWSRVAAPNDKFTIETPCSENEVLGFQGLPRNMGVGIDVDPSARVICSNENFLGMAGLVSEPNASPKGPNLFNSISDGVANNPKKKGKLRITKIDGRRAILSTDTGAGIAAQTGFIEVSNASIIILVSTVHTTKVTDPAMQMEILDRFANSAKVTVQ